MNLKYALDLVNCISIQNTYFESFETDKVCLKGPDVGDGVGRVPASSRGEVIAIGHVQPLAAAQPFASAGRQVGGALRHRSSDRSGTQGHAHFSPSLNDEVIKRRGVGRGAPYYLP